MTLADTAVELTTANGSNPCTITVAWQMAVSHFLALVANDRSRFPPAAGMGTEYAFVTKESCRSQPLKAERQVSGGMLPD